MLFSGSCSRLYLQSRSLRFSSRPMEGGRVFNMLLFTSSLVREVRPLTVSGSVASWQLLRSSTRRFCIEPISGGSAASMLFSRLR